MRKNAHNKKEKFPMYPEDPIKPKRSLGALRKANKSKPKSPDVQGNIAGWFNKDSSGQYLTVELSPRYIPREREEPINMFDTFFQEKEDAH
jgi:hypothetical protein